MFPPVESASEDGLLCWGGELSTPTLVAAYRRGIFPWPHEGYPLLWFAPPRRGILFCEEIEISRRTRRALRAANFEMKIDANFAATIRACAASREYSEGTWINNEVIAAYEELHALGIAHSVETYRDGELVGGLYGVSFGKYFGGESMFHRENNASKAALFFLCEYLQARGALWIDCQLQNPFFEKVGVREIPRDEFTRMLHAALSDSPALFPTPFSNS
jgi:leucyl/phenylalanyl-tRNA--protein transferase